MIMLNHTLLLFVGSLALAIATKEIQSPVIAITKLSGPGSIQGNVTFTQQGNKVHITGLVLGLGPCTANCNRGFHVHAKGDITGGCLSAGSHFNPENKSHGHPNDTDRHVGDLGNVQTLENGSIIIDFYDSKITLVGPHSIIGRSLVLHEGTDDYGKGNQSDSKTTGHAGGRIACGVIGILTPIGAVPSSAVIASFSTAILIPLLFLAFTK